MEFQNRVAVVTGAASGIGRGLAQSLAQRGCQLALVDIQEAGLAETAQSVEATGVRVSQFVMNVTDRQAVADLPQKVLATHGRVDALFNNAGVALGGTFEQISEADFEWVMDVNFHSLVRLTRAFLPSLKVSDEARIVNISSLFGLISPPGQTAYSASKFAVRAFSNALRYELAGSSVGVTVAHPGGVATSIAKSARVGAGVPSEEWSKQRELADRLLRMPPQKAAEIIVVAAQANQSRVIVGGDAWFGAWLERLMPVSYWKILERGMR